MALEMLVGLNVIDDEAYQSYRDEMMPILKNYGGGFGYDFKVSEVLKSEKTHLLIVCSRFTFRARTRWIHSSQTTNTLRLNSDILRSQ